MKVYISDICALCCPEGIGPTKRDMHLERRVKERVFKELGLGPTRPERKGRVSRTLRTALLAAALISLLSVSAFAAVRFAMQHRQPGETVSGFWREWDEAGNVVSEQKLFFPDAGLVFSFTGPETGADLPEFRCFWLPSEADFGYTDAEGWTSYLSDSGEGDSIPWIISASSVNTAKCRLVMNGKTQVITEEKRGEWHVLEIASDYSDCSGRYVYENSAANYILMFDESRGWLVTVKGTSDMDTLRRIAENLELRESERPRPAFENTETIGVIDVGRG